MVSVVPDQLYNLDAIKHLAFDILKANKQTTKIRTQDFDIRLQHLLDELR